MRDCNGRFIPDCDIDGTPWNDHGIRGTDVSGLKEMTLKDVNEAYGFTGSFDIVQWAKDYKSGILEDNFEYFGSHDMRLGDRLDELADMILSGKPDPNIVRNLEKFDYPFAR